MPKVVTKTIDEGRIDASNFYAKGVLVILEVRKWGATAKLTDEMSRQILGEDEDVIRATQDLLKKEDRDLLEAMQTLKGEAFRYLFKISVASPIPNFHFVLKEDIVTIDEYLRKIQEQYMGLAKEFCSKRDDFEKRFAAAKPKLYRPDKYPTKAAMLSRFIFQWTFKQVSPPSKDMGILSPELYKREEQNFKREIAEMKSAVTKTFKISILERLQALEKSCTNGKTSQATINSVNNLLEKYEKLFSGFIADVDLRKAASELNEYIEGTDAAMLRADEDFRSMIGEKAKEIAKTVQNIREPAPDRFLDF